MRVLSDRIIDDGRKGFSFPIFPLIRDHRVIDLTQGDIVTLWWHLSPIEERRRVEYFLKEGVRSHIIGWSSASVVRVLREYYTSLGIYDPLTKYVSIDPQNPPHVTLGTTLDLVLFAECDFRKFPFLKMAMTPPRTTEDRKEIRNGINEGIIATLDLSDALPRSEVEQCIARLITEATIAPFRMGQVLSYGYQRIGLRSWDTDTDDEIRVSYS